MGCLGKTKNIPGANWLKNKLRLVVLNHAVKTGQEVIKKNRPKNPKIQKIIVYLSAMNSSFLV